MTFEEKLAEVSVAVETYLVGVLDASDAGTASGGPPSKVPARLGDAMRHATLAGGKRFRPFLVIETAGLFGIAADRAMPAAAALECIHCYSLAHDDLPAMDNDELRRGLPSVWKAYDEWTAILAGDGLLTFAFELLARHGDLDAATRVTLVGIMAAAAGPAGMVGGQVLDLAASKLPHAEPLSAAEIERLEAMKTGALIRCACDAGAVIGAASPDQRKALVQFGRELGLAFQIADDLLDAEGEAATVGKATGKDTAQGKATLVGLSGIAAAKARLAATEAAAIESLASFGVRADILRQAARFVSRRTR